MTAGAEFDATSATGSAYPRMRGGGASRPQQAGIDVASGFDGNEGPSRENPPADVGGPFTVKGGSVAFLYGVKISAHAHDRMEERTPFDRSKVDKIQQAVNVAGLKPGVYYLPLRSANGEIRGYAQFKEVKGRNSPVLATVLSAFMTPSGVSIETKLKLSAAFDTDQIDPRPPGSLAHNLNHSGVGEGVGGTPMATSKPFKDMDMLSNSDTASMNTPSPEAGVTG